MEIHLSHDEIRLLQAERLVARIRGGLDEDFGFCALELVSSPIKEVRVPVYQQNFLLLCHNPCLLGVIEYQGARREKAIFGSGVLPVGGVLRFCGQIL